MRNQGGDQTTVKQPLPLPQGVSDLAVGAAAPAPMMMKSVAPGMLPRDKSAAEGTFSADMLVAETGKNRAESKPAPEPASGAAFGSYQREQIATVLANQGAGLTACISAAAAKFSGSKLIVRLTVDAKGRILKAEILSSALADVKAEQCLIEAFKQLNLPATADGKPTELTLRLAIDKSGKIALEPAGR